MAKALLYRRRQYRYRWRSSRISAYRYRRQALAQRLRLSPEDQRIYDAHFEVGREIIISIDSLAQMENLYIDLYKRYDAWQDAIAMPSRIVAVVRGFDDLMLAGEKMTYKELSQKMAAARGTLYCPEIVDVLMDIARKYHTWPARSRKR